MTLIQLSDCHVDDPMTPEGRLACSNLEKIVDTIKLLPKKNAILITGDLSHSGTYETYALLAEILSPTGLPIFTVPGNHDNRENLSKIFANDKECLLGKWEVLLLDSKRENKISGFLTDETFRLANSRLNTSPAKFFFIALHHPPSLFFRPERYALKNTTKLFSFAKKNPKIKGICWGHTHHADQSQNGLPALYSCPSTKRQFDGKQGFGFNSYALNANGAHEFQTHWLESV